MIVEALLNFLFGIIEFMFGLLPTIELGFVDNIGWVLDKVSMFISTASYFLPMSDLLAILGAVLVIQNFHIILYFVNWIVRRIADIIP